ncbi:CBS and ACT domain-containing protein [Desulfocurvibacter africanus]|uniref:CBS domain containing membrane protein n=1 Tax=Desulfocurvibacter africanus subsp. africanus str. Walvis Bay TaxID=690850 RepID=F3Z147_DESAF|nr:CBS and ACT domain-containing protein [Desulfocurvibacter africanus]EGJ49945.1 CBS domain containing membrane protein [Desulfocurvibacter africanus subsp. africanus str. Walvis Bay]
MLIKDWMNTPVITIGPDESMMKASKLLKDKNIRRLPVVDDTGKLIGILSDRDIKEASPSKATTLDVHELYYLLSEIKVKDIMTKNPVRLKAEDSVEKAAVLLSEKSLGGLPIVDDNDSVVGIITEKDMFDILIEITRVRDGGVQMGFQLPRTPGALKPILEDLAGSGAKILSIITVYPKGQPNRKAFIRIDEMEKSELNKLRDALASRYELLFFLRDNLHSLI